MTFTFLLQVDFQFQSENFLIGLIDIHLVRYDNIFQDKWHVRFVTKEYWDICVWALDDVNMPE